MYNVGFSTRTARNPFESRRQRKTKFVSIKTGELDESRACDDDADGIIKLAESVHRKDGIRYLSDGKSNE